VIQDSRRRGGHRRRIAALAAALALAGAVVAGPVPQLVPAAEAAGPNADMFGSQWNDLDTTSAASNFKSQLTAYSGYLALNSLALTSMSSLFAQSDAVWADFGHGGAGFITFCHPALGAACTSVLRANSTVGSCGGGNSDDCISVHGTTIHRIRLMVFAGCDTGLNGSSGSNHGNLLDQAYAQGVDMDLGFTNLIYYGGNTGEYWAKRFGMYLNDSATIASAVIDATSDLKALHGGNAYGFNYNTGRGPNNSIIPAGYGS
jgi:hypothetical protein